VNCYLWGLWASSGADSDSQVGLWDLVSSTSSRPVGQRGDGPGHVACWALVLLKHPHAVALRCVEAASCCCGQSCVRVCHTEARCRLGRT
jgi:hypothetical protein